jgi:hypothetical protein
MILITLWRLQVDLNYRSCYRSSFRSIQ